MTAAGTHQAGSQYREPPLCGSQQLSCSIRQSHPRQTLDTNSLQDWHHTNLRLNPRWFSSAAAHRSRSCRFTPPGSSQAAKEIMPMASATASSSSLQRGSRLPSRQQSPAAAAAAGSVAGAKATASLLLCVVLLGTCGLGRAAPAGLLRGSRREGGRVACGHEGWRCVGFASWEVESGELGQLGTPWHSNITGWWFQAGMTRPAAHAQAVRPAPRHAPTPHTPRHTTHATPTRHAAHTLHGLAAPGNHRRSRRRHAVPGRAQAADRPGGAGGCVARGAMWGIA